MPCPSPSRWHWRAGRMLALGPRLMPALPQHTSLWPRCSSPAPAGNTRVLQQALRNPHLMGVKVLLMGCVTPSTATATPLLPTRVPNVVRAALTHHVPSSQSHTLCSCSPHLTHKLQDILPLASHSCKYPSCLHPHLLHAKKGLDAVSSAKPCTNRPQDEGMQGCVPVGTPCPTQLV